MFPRVISNRRQHRHLQQQQQQQQLKRAVRASLGVATSSNWV